MAAVDLPAVAAAAATARPDARLQGMLLGTHDRRAGRFERRQTTTTLVERAPLNSGVVAAAGAALELAARNGGVAIAAYHGAQRQRPLWVLLVVQFLDGWILGKLTRSRSLLLVQEKVAAAVASCGGTGKARTW